jgi:hypothetical protein
MILFRELIETIKLELKDDYFSKKSPKAYTTVLKILDSINHRKELNAYSKKYLQEDLHVWNLIAKAIRILKRSEPILFLVGDTVSVPSKVYKTGYEQAIVKEIDYKDYKVLVQPTRERAEVFWISTDAITKKEQQEKKEVNKPIEQLCIFDFIN